MTLVELIAIISKQAETIFRQCGAVGPAYYCWQGDDKLMLARPPPVADKSLGIAMVKMMMMTAGITRYVFVDEAWMLCETAAKPPKDMLAEANKRWPKGLKHAAGRLEVVVFVAEDQSGLAMARRIIQRPPGKKARLGPLEIMSESGGSFEGRMVGLLPRPQGKPMQ
jgi:hypothetical protein